MSARRYTIGTTYDARSPNGRYEITDMGTKGYCNLGRDPVVWERNAVPSDDVDGAPYPADVRAKYEELNGIPEFLPEGEGEPSVNVVELISDEEGGFDQPCKFGNRCGGHAVYCHNDAWLYAPRKCRRTWYTGGGTRDEDCRGFKPNPNFDAVDKKDAQ